VLHLFREFNRSGVTIVVVTHDRSVAKHARRVLTFRSGCLEGEQRVDA
jgi:putative ABC transport system ATP-binding protein